MKKIAIVLSIIGLISVLFATEMIVHKTDGTQVPFEISEIERITFDSNNVDCYTVTSNNVAIEYPIAELEFPNSNDLYYNYVMTTSETGFHMGERPGTLVPATQGEYIYQAQASAWYNVLSTNSSNPSIEFRYFAYDITTNEITEGFSINYQHQWASNYIGVLREWIWETPMPIDYQLGPNEILGFITITHTHGAPNIFYEYEYYYNSTQTPTYIDVWYSSENYTRYYVNDSCGD